MAGEWTWQDHHADRDEKLERRVTLIIDRRWRVALWGGRIVWLLCVLLRPLGILLRRLLISAIILRLPIAILLLLRSVIASLLRTKIHGIRHYVIVYLPFLPNGDGKFASHHGPRSLAKKLEASVAHCAEHLDVHCHLVFMPVARPFVVKQKELDEILPVLRGFCLWIASQIAADD